MQDSPQPSTANIAAACAILGGVTGYFIGQAKSLGLFGGSALSPTRSSSSKRTEKDDSSDNDDDDSEDDSDDDTAPAEFPGHTEECKMVLVVRTDLGMTKGTHGRHDNTTWCGLV
jgi:PTH2 family peptidyl-tRNA hydrolase